jgi:hypothetical protein
MLLKNATCPTRTRTECGICGVFTGKENLIKQTNSKLDILFSLFLTIIIGLCKYLDAR